jgi:hypothetical protein
MTKLTTSSVINVKFSNDENNNDKDEDACDKDNYVDHNDNDEYIYAGPGVFNGVRMRAGAAARVRRRSTTGWSGWGRRSPSSSSRWRSAPPP